jgi:hypothetical protein
MFMVMPVAEISTKAAANERGWKAGKECVLQPEDTDQADHDQQHGHHDIVDQLVDILADQLGFVPAVGQGDPGWPALLFVSHDQLRGIDDIEDIRAIALDDPDANRGFSV